jgi:hypothetical protein
MAGPAPWQGDGSSITLIVFREPALVHTPARFMRRHSASHIIINNGR